jgi:hypothetical protein
VMVRKACSNTSNQAAALAPVVETGVNI